MLEQKLGDLRKGLAAEKARRVREQQKVTQKANTAELPSRRWLMSTRVGGKVHREASGISDNLPSWAWTTGCGWRFGSSSHYDWVQASRLDGLRALFCERGCDVRS